MSLNSIHAIFDSSGSFLEMGKNRLSRNLRRTIVQLKKIHSRKSLLCLNVVMYSLADSLLPIDIKDNDDVPLTKSIGKTNINELCEFIEKLSISNNDEQVVLFFTDGCFSNNDAQKLKDVLIKNGNVHLISVSIGIDSNLANLNLFSEVVFTADNILLSIDYAITLILGKINEVKSIDDIAVIDEAELFIEPKAEASTDEW